ncbi:hypothetical protein Rhe02_47250 [Rhizocola hellebori]|uniref:Cutinase family protein n=1 Tax=Rhizocola hellebori TaxID=1392758 RepID=A0A8J3VI75_9ACTN|nr:FG-GAP-like repeat-containing protein [Rhizocola hellebori]GIH06658.1 hypothetical protein Rhe02_47250 [Rhizocola hellebori]
MHLVFARGSGAGLGSPEALKFFDTARTQLTAVGLSSSIAEVGDLDNNGVVGLGEYPALYGFGWVMFPTYSGSVDWGVTELINYLNDRVTRPGCQREAIVLGGYSQGADVVGTALQDPRLHLEALSHIAYMATYGDPRHNTGSFFGCLVQIPQWVKGDAGCTSDGAPLQPRYPYARSGFEGKTGSWCATGDGICSHNILMVPGTHASGIYTNTWIPDSAPVIATAARAKANEFNAQPPPAAGNPFGYLDAAGIVADKLYVRGWAIDPDTTGSITIHTYVDGNHVGATTANTSRPDIGAAYPSFGNNHGYYAEYAVGYGAHQVCSYAINTGAGSANPQLPSCRTVLRPVPARNNADFDGNNHDDLVLLAQPASGSGVAVNVGKSTGSGYWMQQWWADSYTPFVNATPLAGDVSGDGKADYIYLLATTTGSEVWVARSTGTAFSPAERWWTGNGWGYAGIKPSLGDMNGDGAEDLVLTTNEPTGGTAVNVALSTRTGFATQTLWWFDIYTDWTNMTPLIGDVTGDKVADYTFTTPSPTGVKAWMLKSTYAGLAQPQVWWDGSGWVYSRIKANLGDIDGNGANDLVLTYREPDGSTSLHIGRSTLSGFWVQLWWYDPYTSWDWMTPFVGNVNGDGNDDYGFTTPSPGGTGAWVLRSTNTTLLTPQVWWNGEGWGYSGIKVARR